MEPDPDRRADVEDREEVHLVARGIATAVAPDTGLTDVQADLLEAIASALTGVDVDYRALTPLDPEGLAAVLEGRDLHYRQRIVHHMVLAELVLRPIPVEVAHRVHVYAQALGVKDDFVRLARRYAQGAFGLAYKDLQRNGFAAHLQGGGEGEIQPGPGRGTLDPAAAPFAPAELDPALEATWRGFAELPPDTLGYQVWDMYDARGFELPGGPGGAPRYLAQHDFVHVLADYGTNLRGELEVFSFIGRADPDPKGFAWLATLTGLFETGYIPTTGFFDRDVRERVIQAPGMHRRVADAIRRGKVVCRANNLDLFEVDYYAVADRPVEELRVHFAIPPKGEHALEAGSVGLFDLAGMSEIQQQAVAARRGAPQ